MQKSYTFYQNTGYWFLLLIPLVIIGFYPSYFSVLSKPTPTIIHLHFGIMAIWVMMLIIQPFLYKYKKLSWHRAVGKLSYFIVPLLLITAYFMIRFSYFRFIGDLEKQVTAGKVQLTHQQVLREAATYEAIAFLYFGWLAIFYLLAVINRRRSSVHARYMIAAALTMLGPTVDRIIYSSFKVIKLGGVIPIETISFFIADLVLVILLVRDWQKKRNLRPLSVGLSIFLGGQIIYFLIQKTEVWDGIVAFILRP